MKVQPQGEERTWWPVLLVLPLAVTVPWAVTGTLSPGRATLLTAAGAVLLIAVGLFRPRLLWLLAPLLLLGTYVLLMGWVDMPAAFPAAALLALGVACGLDGAFPRRCRELVALLGCGVVGLGVALGLMPATALLVLLAAPLTARAARRADADVAAGVSAYAVTTLFLWVGYLIQGIVR